MSNFKPCCYIEKIGESEVRQFKTYALLKRNIKALIEETENVHLHVYRSRRGEWGEWFEHWKMVNGKPTIVKEGWE
jgi:hypothetical protein